MSNNDSSSFKLFSSKYYRRKQVAIPAAVYHYLGLQDDNIGVSGELGDIPQSHSIGNSPRLTDSNRSTNLAMARPRSALPSARSRQHSAAARKVGRMSDRLGMANLLSGSNVGNQQILIQTDRDYSSWSERKESLERLLGNKRHMYNAYVWCIILSTYTCV